MQLHIYLLKSSKFKKMSFDDMVDLYSKLSINHIDEHEDFIKQLKKFNDLYCYIDPSYFELGGDKTLCWSLIEQEAMDDYHTACEEI